MIHDKLKVDFNGEVLNSSTGFGDPILWVVKGDHKKIHNSTGIDLKLNIWPCAFNIFNEAEDWEII